MNHVISIYLDHFGLNERPFSLVPDPDFIYWSTVHDRAYTMFEFGLVTRSPITLITGDVGAGDLDGAAGGLVDASPAQVPWR